MKNLEEPTVYHVIPRTCLPGHPFESVENDELLKIIQRFSRIYFIEIVRILNVYAALHPDKTILPAFLSLGGFTGDAGECW